MIQGSFICGHVAGRRGACGIRTKFSFLNTKGGRLDVSIIETAKIQWGLFKR